MKYLVVAYRTMTLMRALAVDKKFYGSPMRWGPYKGKRFANKVARKLRADRCQTVDRVGGAVTDHGKSFRNVRVVEMPEGATVPETMAAINEAKAVAMSEVPE